MKKLLVFLLLSAFSTFALEIPIQEWKEFDAGNPLPNTVVKAEPGVSITSVRGYCLMYCSLQLPESGSMRIAFKGNADNAPEAKIVAQLRNSLSNLGLCFSSSTVQKDGTLVLGIPASLRSKKAYLLLSFEQPTGCFLKVQICSIDFTKAVDNVLLDDFKAQGMGVWKEFDAANPLPDKVQSLPEGLQLTMSSKTYAVIYRDVELSAGTAAVSLDFQGQAVSGAKVQFILRSKNGQQLDDVTVVPNGEVQNVLLKNPAGGGSTAVVLVFLHRGGNAFNVTMQRMEAVRN